MPREDSEITPQTQCSPSPARSLIVTSASGIDGLTLDSISWASIGIQQVSVRCFESGPALATVTAKPSAYTLLGHPCQHYIPASCVLNPLRPRCPVQTG